MKVAIATIIDNDNYGNRLQNYALYHYLKCLNYDVITILNESYSNTKKYFFIRKIKNIRYKGTYSNNLLRKKKFEEFNKYIDFTNRQFSIYSNFDKFDYFVAGSDQIWNPYCGRLRDFDLLAFAPPEKRISYAASIGINNIPENKIPQFKKELLKFNAISVREETAKHIVENITDRKDIKTLIDPTMLLSAEEWDKVSKRPEQLDKYNIKKYILTYFFGNVNSVIQNEIERIALENNCKIIDILDKNNPFYEIGPSEFLYLEKNAFLICTNSFHSCVFAIIYDRPFVVFKREQKNVVNMSSRIETLVDKFKLKNRKFNGKNITPENLKHNYSEAYKILETERKKSCNFLKNLLK